MKRIFALLLVVTVFATLMVSCGEDKTTTTSDDITPPAVNTDDIGGDETDPENDSVDVASTNNIQSIYDSLIETGDFPPMYVLSSEELPEYFTVSSELFSEYVAAVAEEYPAIERIFIGKLAASENKDEAVAGLKAAIESLEAEYIDYLPLEYEKSKKCSIEESGDYIFYIICENINDAVKIVNDSLSNI